MGLRGVGQAAWSLARGQRGDGGWSGAGAGLRGIATAPSAALTAAAVQALAAAGRPESRAVRRGVAWLLRAQLPDGSWQDCLAEPADPGTAITGPVLLALLEVGVLPGKPSVSSGAGWLIRRQNPDGGWGQLPGRPSAVAATTGTVLALLAVSSPEVADSLERAGRWLAAAILPAGAWPDQRSTDEQGDCCELAGRLITLAALRSCLPVASPAGMHSAR
jgi:prenyltransferase beta subunit